MGRVLHNWKKMLYYTIMTAGESDEEAIRASRFYAGKNFEN